MTNKNYKSISSERDRDNIALSKQFVNEIWNKQRIEIIEDFFHRILFVIMNMERLKALMSGRISTMNP